jgi:drug/metabolite transporter (DMT)-like permease
MFGILFALFAGFIFAISKLLDRYVLKDGLSLEYTFLNQIFSALIFLGFFAFHATFPQEIRPWIFVAVSSLFWVLTMYTGYKSLESLEASVQGQFSKLRLVFVLVLGVLILGEALLWSKILGTALILMGVLFISPLKNFSFTTKGVLWVVASALFGALAFLTDKYTLQYFNVEEYIFLIYAIPALYLYPFVRKKTSTVFSLLKRRTWPILISIGLSAIGYFFMLYAFKSSDVSIVVPLVEVSILFVILGGIFILHERTHMLRKALSGALVIAGVLLITGVF